jgi:patatin-like phospholipase/acyl hydrolase
MIDPRFQVLAIDGGGIRGIFAAALLARLEEDLGKPVVGMFDLVVGTSTGGIIALALGAGLSPAEIVDFYVTQKDAIFSKPNGWRKVRQLFVAKYRPAPLEKALQGVFGDTLLGESRVPLVIPSYNLGENDVYLLKTPHHERLRRDHKVPMWQAAMASTAAPTFFPAFRLPDSHVRLVDGGVWANNPAMVGVTEAVSMFSRPLEDIRVLSVGTTTSQRTRQSRLDNAGLLRWVRSPNVVEVLLNGQSTGAFTQVQHLLGVEHARRLSPPAPDELAALDACDARDLIAKAAHYSRIFCPDFDAVFGAHIPYPYVPFHGPNARQEAHGLSR